MATLSALHAFGAPSEASGGVDPFGWVFDTATNVIGDTVVSALTAVWQAGLWLLGLGFRVVDAFTTPDLSVGGPMADVLPITLWLGGFTAAIMFTVQLGIALVRRDGQSIGRVLLGIAQFGAVWACYIAVAAGVVLAASELRRGILSATLDVDVLASWDGPQSWAREATDIGGALVLAVTAIFLIIPAAFADILVALVREASLIVLTATAPIAAAGLLSDVGRAWFWKTLRWFLAAAFIAPGSALVLGIGVQISDGTVGGAGAGGSTSTPTAIGMAVVGAGLVAVAAIAPLTLFRLLAFVEPSTASGAAMRQAWSDLTLRGSAAGAGGGAGSSAGSAASTGDGAGRSQGEATADSATASRVASALGMFGRGMQATTSMANRAVDLSTDILGSAGVGHPGYSMTPADERALRAGSGPGAADGGSSPAPPSDPAGPAPAAPPSTAPPSSGPAPAAAPPGAAGAGGGGAGGGAGAAGAGSAGAGGGAAGGAAAVPVVIP